MFNINFVCDTHKACVSERRIFAEFNITLLYIVFYNIHVVLGGRAALPGAGASGTSIAKYLIR